MIVTGRNTAFNCQYCGEKNPPASKTCRNHCRKCLCSVHVDEHIPGDRVSVCYGKMIPQKVEQSSKKGWILVHVCELCGKRQKNKAAQDDDFDQIVKITQRSGEEFLKG